MNSLQGNSQAQFDALDLLAVTGFIIGLLNYTENVDQSTMQESVNQAVRQINQHLQEQDRKIDLICKALDIRLEE